MQYPKKKEEWQAKLGTIVFDPMQVIEMQDAIRAKKTSITISGRLFHIKYEGERCFYAPERGFIPAGWLNIKRFLEEE